LRNLGARPFAGALADARRVSPSTAERAKPEAICTRQRLEELHRILDRSIERRRAERREREP
jgi:hypothetical protein